MTIGFTTPANAKASAEHIARKLKGFPEGFHDKWSEADRNAHYAAEYPHIAATRLAKANINRTPVSDMGNDGPGAPLAEYVGPGSWDDVEVVTPTEPKPKLAIVNAASLLASGPAPKRRWHVPGMIPAQEVTTLGGDGATGKSLLALQLGVATVAGSDWIGTFPEKGRVLFLSAEDDIDEVWRRLEDIARHQHLDASDLANLDIVPLAGLDAVLAAPSGKDGTLSPTMLFEQVRLEIEDRRPDLVILDTQSDLFGGDEIKRLHARQFIGLLKGLALKFNLTVLLLSHPSLSGMASGAGTSGSTAWNNSVRSRIYLERPPTNGDDDEETDDRILTTKKANRGRVGGKIALRWRDGVFVLNIGTSPDKLEADAGDERTFLAILAEFARSGNEVSRSVGKSYAPSQFAKSPSANGLSNKRLEAAMERLFTANRIHTETSGPPSKRTKRIKYGPAPMDGER